MSISLVLADAVSAVLVSWWKALLILIPLVAWAWLVAVKLDKDAKYFYLNRRMWNGVHMAAGIAAVASFLLIPIFWVAWPVGVVLLAGPVLTYWYVRNREVPEDKQFRITSEKFAEKMEARKLARATRGAAITFIDATGRNRQVPLRDDPAFAVQIAAEDVVGPALEARASRVEMVVSAKGATVTQTVDGVRYKREPIAPDLAIKVLNMIKELADLNIEDQRRRQAGDFRLNGPTGAVNVHVTAEGSSTAQALRLDFNRGQQMVEPFDAMGFLPAQQEALKTFVGPGDRHGIILVGAPDYDALYHATYSLLARHDAYTCNIKTLEAEVLTEIDGIDHMRWNPSNPDVDFASNLQSILRRDPDIVMTSEPPDAQTVKVALEPGLDGPLIYVPLRAPSTAEMIRRWVGLAGDVGKAVKPLRAVINLRMLRQVCSNCRQAYQPSAEQLRKMNLPAGKVRQLYRASGKVQIKNKIESCPVCRGLGYLGQTGAFEVMIVDDEARRILTTGDLKAALAHARRNKMMYLQEAALGKVISGETTLEEVVRVTASQQETKPPPPAPQPATVG